MTTHHAQACHNCGSTRLNHFYNVDNVPVHSVLLMRSRTEAIEYPKKDIELGLCLSCGFIQNNRFDPHCHEYSERYEETQGFSRHFQKHLYQLAADLIERYQVRNKTVVEIGCGKGEFLSLLCQLGGNRGIGIDASYVPGRLEGNDDLDIIFIQDFFENNTSILAEADLIVCRHTLEHIPYTAKFLRKLRQAIPEDRRPVIFFDLPDATRILKENAFWDIYYEHCSYFTPSSISAVFRAEGFCPTELYRLYDGQALAIEAYPERCSSPKKFAIESSTEELATLADSFSQRTLVAVHDWKRRIQKERRLNRSICIWGSGSKAVSFISAMGSDCNIDVVIDINPHRQGTYLLGSGYKIEPPEILSCLRPDIVIVMNPLYKREIAQYLSTLGVNTDLVSL